MTHSGFPHGSTTLNIDLDAVAANWRILCERMDSGRSAAVVKADGYGLGAEKVVARLIHEGCRLFFTAHLDEAVGLRTVFTRSDVEFCAMNGPFPGEAEVYHAHDILPTLNDPGQIALWRDYCRKVETRLGAVLHVDTGINRTGLMPRDAEALIADPSPLDGMEIRYLMSHLACADMPEHDLNVRQRDLFRHFADGLPKTSGGAMLANSSGIFLGPGWHFDLARPGVSLYGVNPTPGLTNPMRPVVSLHAKILQLREVDAPETVGYGAAHRVERSARIATVAVGYADGFLRCLGASAATAAGAGRIASAYIGDQRVPVVGRVSMDLVTIDVTSVAQVAPGDIVTMIGPHYDVDALARDAGTIGYEILTSLGRRYRRIYHGDET